MDEENNSNWIGAIIGIVIIGAVIWWFSGAGKYEGETAEYWFNAYDEAEAKYDEFRSCVEDYDNFDIQEQIDYGGVFYYCE